MKVSFSDQSCFLCCRRCRKLLKFSFFSPKPLAPFQPNLLQNINLSKFLVAFLKFSLNNPFGQKSLIGLGHDSRSKTLPFFLCIKWFTDAF